MQIVVYLVNDNHGEVTSLPLEFGLIFDVLMEAEPNPSRSIAITKRVPCATLIVSIRLCYRCE